MKSIPLRACLSGFAIAGAVAALVPNAAYAVINEQDFFSNSGFTVSSNDLLNGISPTAISGTGDQEGLNTDTTGGALTNGAFGPAGLVNSPGPNPEVTIFQNGASVTYTLPSLSNITEIETFSGWRDAGRSQQDYIVSTSTDGATFTPLDTVHSGNASTNPADVAVDLQDSSGTLASGVKAIRFDFPSTQNGFVGYREIDVFGTAAVPEPSTWLAAGGLVLLAAGDFRRRLRA